jgi:Holliday junction resolvase
MMANRAWHYERAFESFLRGRQLSIVPVNESRRAFADGAAIKSLDYIVAGAGGQTLLIDVKGRVMGARGAVDYWATADDLDGLAAWRGKFGDQAVAALAFVLELPDPALGRDFVDRFAHEGRDFACLAVELDAFRSAMKPRSPKWRTYSLPRGAVAALARPLSHWTQPLAAAR